MTVYFSKKLFTFYSDLKKNNRRDWFAANKDRYKDHVETPVLQFIAELSPKLKDISPHFEAIPKVNGGSMFRIYRDTRFSKHKIPYKEHAACRFCHSRGDGVHSPCFYLAITPQSVRFGAGIWMPKPDHLFAIRQRILQAPGEWEDTLDALAENGYADVNGETLKRPPRGFDKEAQFIHHIKLKSFFVNEEHSNTLALRPDFMDHALDSYKRGMPLIGFICRALEFSV